MVGRQICAWLAGIRLREPNRFRHGSCLFVFSVPTRPIHNAWLHAWISSQAAAWQPAGDTAVRTRRKQKLGSSPPPLPSPPCSRRGGGSTSKPNALRQRVLGLESLGCDGGRRLAGHGKQLGREGSMDRCNRPMRNTGGQGRQDALLSPSFHSTSCAAGLPACAAADDQPRSPLHCHEPWRRVLFAWRVACVTEMSATAGRLLWIADLAGRAMQSIGRGGEGGAYDRAYSYSAYSTDIPSSCGVTHILSRAGVVWNGRMGGCFFAQCPCSHSGSPPLSSSGPYWRVAPGEAHCMNQARHGATACGNVGDGRSAYGQK